jgi:hypothetical protein
MLELRLRALNAPFRLGLTGIVLSLLLGVWASLEHLQDHHHNRDGEPGVSMDDLVGAYHGLDRPARLVVALSDGHPEELPEAERTILLDWLGSRQVSEQYDALELGDASPAEVIDRRCLSCHARQATEGDGIGQEVPLEYWDDVAKLAFSRSVEATPQEILITSLHTHALSMALVTLAAMGLLLATRWPSALIGLLAGVGGLGLIVDLASQLLARGSEAFVYGVAVGGGLWGFSTVAACLAVLADLWLPGGRSRR